VQVRGFQLVADADRRPLEVHLEGDPVGLGDAPDRWRKLAGRDLAVRFVDDLKRSRSGKILPVLGAEG
jgi:hypothetical protein